VARWPSRSLARRRVWVGPRHLFRRPILRRQL
jgi:hypothetical protein